MMQRDRNVLSAI